MNMNIFSNGTQIVLVNEIDKKTLDILVITKFELLNPKQSPLQHNGYSPEDSVLLDLNLSIIFKNKNYRMFSTIKEKMEKNDGLIKTIKRGYVTDGKRKVTYDLDKDIKEQLIKYLKKIGW